MGGWRIFFIPKQHSRIGQYTDSLSTQHSNKVMHGPEVASGKCVRPQLPHEPFFVSSQTKIQREGKENSCTSYRKTWKLQSTRIYAINFNCKTGITGPTYRPRPERNPMLQRRVVGKTKWDGCRRESDEMWGIWEDDNRHLRTWRSPNRFLSALLASEICPIFDLSQSNWTTAEQWVSSLLSMDIKDVPAWHKIARDVEYACSLSSWFGYGIRVNKGNVFANRGLQGRAANRFLFASPTTCPLRSICPSPQICNILSDLKHTACLCSGAGNRSVLNPTNATATHTKIFRICGNLLLSSNLWPSQTD